MSAGKIIGGVVALAAIVGVVVVATRGSSDGPRPSPDRPPPPGSTNTPGEPPAPGTIPTAADLIEHAGHKIYLWEQLDDALAFVEWRYVTLDPSGLIFASGAIKTPGVTGAEETKAAAIAEIDRKFVP